MIPGATAALSLDPSRVGASVQDGLVTLVGRGPGSTNVIVIVGDRHGHASGPRRRASGHRLPGMRTGSAQNGGTGYYEARYGSDPGIFQGSLFVSRREGDRSAELALGGAAPLGRRHQLAVQHSAGFVHAAHAQSRDDASRPRDLELAADDFPLERSRGVSARRAHGRCTRATASSAPSSTCCCRRTRRRLPASRYRHRLTPRSSLTPNLFYFDGPSRSGRRGALGTLLYETRTASDVKFVAELGVSRSLGGALEIEARSAQPASLGEGASCALRAAVAHHGPAERTPGRGRMDMAGRQIEPQCHPLFAPLHAGDIRADEQCGRVSTCSAG